MENNPGLLEKVKLHPFAALDAEPALPTSHCCKLKFICKGSGWSSKASVEPELKTPAVSFPSDPESKGHEL